MASRSASLQRGCRLDLQTRERRSSLPTSQGSRKRPMNYCWFIVSNLTARKAINTGCRASQASAISSLDQGTKATASLRWPFLAEYVRHTAMLRDRNEKLDSPIVDDLQHFSFP